jgi:protein-L-isoaspartate O-methyltransferase
VQQVELSAKEARVFEDFDGETWLRDMVERHGPKRIARVVEKLAHHDVQAIKLARVPMSYFEVEGRQHLKPPYLTSTMPYAPYDPTTDPAPKPFEAEFSPEGYYRHEVADAEAQFDHQETTLSHLFRHPHPALRGQTYGSALVAGLEAKGLLEGETLRVLEIGGGLGFVAKAVVEALQARDKTVTYDILELSPALAKAQRERTAGLPVTIHEGDVLTDPWPADAYDVIVANEMIGDLPAVQLTREQLGLDVDEEMDEEAYDALFAERLAALGEVGAYLDKYKIPVGDSPPEFYLNLGAFKLAEHIAARLAPGGFAILTEFGEMGRYPVLSTQLDHPELSIHFGHLAFVGRELGLDYDFVYVMDLIDMDRDAEGLATTRSYFKALKALLAEHEVELEKIGYTRTMFEALIAGKLAPDRFGELHFELIENRLMGLVPHEFKALIFKRKAD